MIIISHRPLDFFEDNCSISRISTAYFSPHFQHLVYMNLANTHIEWNDPVEGNEVP